MKLKTLLHNSSNEEQTFRLEPACHIEPMRIDSSLELILDIKHNEAVLELEIENDAIVVVESNEIFVNIYKDGKLVY